MGEREQGGMTGEGGGTSPMREAMERDLSPDGLALRDALDEFAAENRRNPIVLAGIAAVVAWVRWMSLELEPIPASLQFDLGPFSERLRGIWREDPGYPGEYYVAGDLLVEADGPNQRHPVEPIMRAFGDPIRPPAGVRARDREVRSGMRKALRAADRLLRDVRRRGLLFPKDVLTPHRLFLMAAQSLAHCRALIREYDPSAVLVLATPNQGPRALVHAARRMGVPSVYLPHTSVLAEVSLNDLPTDYAGLRGSEEVAHYAEAIGRARLGSRADQVEVVGDPSMTETPEMPPFDESLPPVLAPPIEEEYLRAVVALVSEAVEGPVLVSPHPEADLDLLAEVIPPEWDTWADRTYDLLRKGPPAVLQFTSGVSREALSLGIPTIELRLPPDRPISYAMIREPHIKIVSSAEELRRAIERARAEVRDPSAREALRDWARRWSWPAGEEAARRGIALVRRAASAPPPGPIWSPWPDPGNHYRASLHSRR